MKEIGRRFCHFERLAFDGHGEHLEVYLDVSVIVGVAQSVDGGSHILLSTGVQVEVQQSVDEVMKTIQRAYSRGGGE